MPRPCPITPGSPGRSCLRNVVALFHVLAEELAWRRQTGRPEGYGAMKASRPVVAVGPEHSLEDEELMADYFRTPSLQGPALQRFALTSPLADGLDGLHNVHATHPHLCPADTWKSLFHGDGAPDDSPEAWPYFTPSKQPAHLEMLRILRENPVDTVSILAVGPLTNVALAAAHDPHTFLRVKELVVMGGAVNVEGNVTPVAEFNCYADAVAAARLYALTSLTPASTMPPIPAKLSTLPPYPPKLWRQLRLTLAPLDITTPHLITKSYFAERIQPHIDAGSPLATWTAHFIKAAFHKIETLEGDGNEPGLSLHDPLTVWYMLTHDDPGWKFPAKPEDIRVETSGQWTRGMHVIDQRLRVKPAEAVAAISPNPCDDLDVVTMDEVPGDTMGWLSVLKGNRINRIIASPGEEVFKDIWMNRVFS